MAPSVHPEAYVAPTAVLSGDVRVGRGSCIMHGAVLAAEGGPVEIGDHCMIMENAVLRGTPQHPLIMGDHVLARPICAPLKTLAAVAMNTSSAIPQPVRCECGPAST